MEAQLTDSGKWRARAYNKYTGKRKSFTCNSKKEAIRMANLYEMRVKEEEPESITLRDGIDIYISSRKNIWKSKRTAIDYEGYKIHYTDLLDRPLDSLTDIVLQDWVNDFSSKYSAKYTKNVFSLISRVKKLYGNSPVGNVDRPKIDKPLLNLPAESDVVRYLAFVESVQDDKVMGNMTVPAYLASLCAMRRGEIAGITLSDVNYTDGSIRIRRTMADDGKGGWYFKLPKNGHERIITPPSVVLEKIKQYGLPAFNPNQLSKQQGKIKEMAGIDFGLHALRHYCASRLLSIGCPIADVQEYGGWEDTKILLDIYNYVINESRLKTRAKWEQYSQELMPEIEKTGQKLARNLANP